MAPRAKRRRPWESRGPPGPPPTPRHRSSKRPEIRCLFRSLQSRHTHEPAHHERSEDDSKSCQQESKRNGMGYQNRKIPLADRQRTPQLLLRQRSEEEPDDTGGHGKSEMAHQETDPSEYQQKVDIEGRIIEAVDAQCREHEDSTIEERRRDRQKPHPHTDERQVEHEQHCIADIEAGNQSPHQLALPCEQQRSRMQSIL